jgi:hypothetical protein
MNAGVTMNETTIEFMQTASGHILTARLTSIMHETVLINWQRVTHITRCNSGFGTTIWFSIDDGINVLEEFDEIEKALGFYWEHKQR